MQLYRDHNSYCVGAYRAPHYWFLCPFPTVVLKVKRISTKWSPGAMNRSASVVDEDSE